MYLMSTPYSLYLWIGKNVNAEQKRGTIHLLQVFMRDKMEESTDYQPSYLYNEMNLYSLRLRVEIEGYESFKFKSFFKKSWKSDVNDYLMLRKPKANAYKEDEHEIKDLNEIDNNDKAPFARQKTLMMNILAERDESSEEGDDFNIT